MKDRQGRIIYANPATLTVLSKPASEVIGYRDCDLYPEFADAVMENDRRIMESGQTEEIEELLDQRTFLNIKSPYRNEVGEVIGLIGVSTEITERKQMEADLRGSEDRLRLALESAVLGTWDVT